MISPTTTPQGVMALCREMDIKSVALRYVGLAGSWHQFVIPIQQLSEESFEDGVCIASPQWSASVPDAPRDLLLVPEPSTAFVDPFTATPTLNLLCCVQDPIKRNEFALDPRSLAKRAAGYLNSSGISDLTLCGFEAEYYVFDSVRFRIAPRDTAFTIEGGRSERCLGSGPPAAMQPESLRDTYSRWSIAPDSQSGLREQVLRTLQNCGVPVLGHQQTTDQGIDHQQVTVDAMELLRAADAAMVTKYVVKGIANRMGKTATFMPQPLAQAPGCGLHTQLIMQRSGDSLFAGSGYAGLSDEGLRAVGGILRHAASLAALTCASTNSYRRLCGASDAPHTIAYSQSDRHAAVRIPAGPTSPRQRRLEFRPTDFSANPYLAFSAIALAALDGMQGGDLPGPASEASGIKSGKEAGDGMDESHERLPSSLPEALAALEIDHEYLTRGEVFTAEFLEHWIDSKQRMEVQPINAHPHPMEFALYFDR